jgi:hypothetical protein
LVLPPAEITDGHRRDGVLCAAEDDLSGESLAFAMGRASIDRHTVAPVGFAADTDSQAAGHFLSQSSVQYRAMEGLDYPQGIGGAPKRLERSPQGEA